MSMVSREQTVLRVKRRRNENPPSTIRLELLGGGGGGRNTGRDQWNGEEKNSDGNALPAFLNGPLRSSSTATLADSGMSSGSASTQTATNVTTRTAAAIWKRVIDNGDSPYRGGETQKRCRVVDAIFESDGPSTKRRKLTLLGEAKPTTTTIHDPKTNIYKVLDPTTRLVDDSLTMVHAGDRSVAEHYRLVTTDPRLATHSRAWLVHRNRGGNLLHACATWNDVEIAHDLLRQSLSGLADAVDGDGRTPYETAELCGHDAMTGVLEAFGADTTNFVYDMFVPEEIDVDMSPNHPEWNPLEKSAIHTDDTAGAQAAHDRTLIDTSRLLELQGGVGYWTEDGDLVLEVEAHHMMGITNEFCHDSDEDCGDDIDSNCEDYGGNDYPDEESWEEEFLHEEPLEDDSYGHGPTSDEDDLY